MCVRDCVPPGSDLGSSQPHCVIASERSPTVQQIETILQDYEYASYETEDQEMIRNEKELLQNLGLTQLELCDQT